jgi:hypothetical protein
MHFQAKSILKSYFYRILKHPKTLRKSWGMKEPSITLRSISTTLGPSREYEIPNKGNTAFC